MDKTINPREHVYITDLIIGSGLMNNRVQLAIGGDDRQANREPIQHVIKVKVTEQRDASIASTLDLLHIMQTDTL